MSDPDRKARADKYRLKLMEQYMRLRNASDEQLDRHAHELHELLDAMGYNEQTEIPLRLLAKQKNQLLC